MCDFYDRELQRELERELRRAIRKEERRQAKKAEEKELKRINKERKYSFTDETSAPFSTSSCGRACPTVAAKSRGADPLTSICSRQGMPRSRPTLASIQIRSKMTRAGLGSRRSVLGWPRSKWDSPVSPSALNRRDLPWGSGHPAPVTRPTAPGGADPSHTA